MSTLNQRFLDSLPSTEKILHLREDESKPWRPYKTFSFAVPDYLVPGGSRGYATMQLLMKRGWKLVGTKEAEETIAQQLSSTNSNTATDTETTLNRQPSRA